MGFLGLLKGWLIMLVQSILAIFFGIFLVILGIATLSFANAPEIQKQGIATTLFSIFGFVSLLGGGVLLIFGISKKYFIEGDESKKNNSRTTPSTQDILNNRLAKGEITFQQYRELKNEIK